jgi:chemotaxis protein CheD
VTTPAKPTTGEPIAIGQIGVAKGEGILRTFVGSCVALVLYSKRHRAVGVAHVMLPAAEGRVAAPGKYADTAVAETLRRLTDLVGDTDIACTAKLIGGATMFTFQSGTPIGDQNVLALQALLGDLGIEIVGRLCGGRHGRRVAVDAATGTVTVETAEHGSETL